MSVIKWGVVVLTFFIVFSTRQLAFAAVEGASCLPIQRGLRECCGDNICRCSYFDPGFQWDRISDCACGCNAGATPICIDPTCSPGAQQCSNPTDLQTCNPDSCGWTTTTCPFQCGGTFPNADCHNCSNVAPNDYRCVSRSGGYYRDQCQEDPIIRDWVQVEQCQYGCNGSDCATASPYCVDYCTGSPEFQSACNSMDCVPNDTVWTGPENTATLCWASYEAYTADPNHLNPIASICDNTSDCPEACEGGGGCSPTIAWCEGEIEPCPIGGLDHTELWFDNCGNLDCKEPEPINNPCTEPPGPPGCTCVPPTTPVITAPADGAIIDNDEVNITWNLPGSWGDDCSNINPDLVTLGISNQEAGTSLTQQWASPYQSAYFFQPAGQIAQDTNGDGRVSYYVTVSFNNGQCASFATQSFTLILRPDLCGSVVLSPIVNDPGPNGGINVTVNATTAIPTFSLALYNYEHLYGPGNPMPYCVNNSISGTGSNPSVCLTNYHHYVKSATVSSTNSYTFQFDFPTLNYEDHCCDTVNDPNPASSNWCSVMGGEPNQPNCPSPEKLQLNAYLMDSLGRVSLSDPACVVQIGKVRGRVRLDSTIPSCYNDSDPGILTNNVATNGVNYGVQNTNSPSYFLLVPGGGGWNTQVSISNVNSAYSCIPSCGGNCTNRPVDIGARESTYLPTIHNFMYSGAVTACTMPADAMTITLNPVSENSPVTITIQPPNLGSIPIGSSVTGVNLDYNPTDLIICPDPILWDGVNALTIDCTTNDVSSTTNVTITANVLVDGVASNCSASADVTINPTATVTVNVYEDNLLSCSLNTAINIPASITFSLTENITCTQNNNVHTCPNVPHGATTITYTPTSPTYVNACSSLGKGFIQTIDVSDTNNSMNVFVTQAQPAWFQVQGGDVGAAGGDILSIVPTTADPPYMCLPTTSPPRSVGVALASGNISPSVSEKGWAVANSSFWPSGQIQGYDYFYALGNAATADEFNTSISQFSDIPNPSGLDQPLKAIYNGSSPLIISGIKVVAGESAVIYAPSEVVIDGDITIASGGFLAVIATGKITITSRANEVEGIYITNDVISLDSANQTFNGRGVFVGWSGVTLSRVLDGLENNTTPAEIFTYRGDLIYNAPDFLKRSSFSWQEVTPQ